ncbi:glycosyl transferase [Planctomycetales bacterium]|nr:glycosyl transferase [Planctomycetales bacterium]
MTKVSLIITTYNQPEFLRLALVSALEQTRLPDEIVVADDGSKEETAEVVRRIAADSPVPIIHVWHPDTGFRLAQTRNNGIAASTGDFLIFLDGDCFLNKYYIADYLSFALPNRYVVGTRVNIRTNRRDYILRTNNRSISVFSWGTSKKLHALRSRFLSMLRKKGGMAGASFAVWRSDIERINGFNEIFTRYGGEDNDISERLERAGVKMRKMVHYGIAYHFDHLKAHHPEKLYPDNYKDSLESDGIRCKTGLNRALEEGITILGK